MTDRHAEFLAAQEAHRRGDRERAKAGYAKLLLEDPNDPDARHFLGLLYYQEGDPARAIEEIRRSLETAPKNAAALNNLGNILQQQQEWAEAVNVYQRAIEAAPRDPRPICNLGSLIRRGNLKKSVALLERAVRIDPELGEAWHNLGVSAMLSGDSDRALEAFTRAQTWAVKEGASPVFYAALLNGCGHEAAAIAMLEERLAHDPLDAEAKHLLNAAKGGGGDRAPAAYVQRHFDSFARTFEGVLQNLAYAAPELVAQAARGCFGPLAAIDALDLGCGTGLGGRLLRPLAKRLVGVDLSPGMLAEARTAGGYDELIEAEIDDYLTNAAGPESFDLVISVDALVYIGRLDATIAGVAHVLRPGGAAVFTTERLLAAPARGPGYRLSRSGRYEHDSRYVRALAERAGLAWRCCDPVVPRKEMGADVAGDLIVIGKPTHPSA